MALFIKGVPKGHETHVKESEKRKLKEKLIACFPSLQLSQLELITPKKSDIVTICKVCKDEQILRINGQPMFFDWNRIEMIPTCYTLHRAPQVLRHVQVFEGVDKKLCNGAPLFLPGVYREHKFEAIKQLANNARVPWPAILLGGTFFENELCALVVAGSWAPFAVGRFPCDSTTMAKQSAPPPTRVGGVHVVGDDHDELKGLAVEVLHYMGDFLWNSGTQAPPPSSPPDGLHSWLEAEQSSRHEQEQNARKQLRQQLQDKLKGLEARQSELKSAFAQVEKILEMKADQYVPLTKNQKAKLSQEKKLRADMEEASKQVADTKAEIGALTVAIGGADNIIINNNNGNDAGNTHSDLDVSTIEQPHQAATAEHHNDDDNNDDGNNDNDNDDGNNDNDNDDSNNDHPSGENNNTDTTDANPNTATTTPAAAEADGPTQQEIDLLFSRALFTVLSTEPLPLLANIAFAKASQLTKATVSIKQTSWKKASNFLSQHTHAITSSDQRAGVTTITAFNANALVTPFEPLPADNSTDNNNNITETNNSHTIHRQSVATKSGPAVTINGRRVRNRNVTFVDGLEKWGFSKEGIEDLAHDFRKKLSVSATVSMRGGTDDIKELWSLQVQGQMGQELVELLKQRGVTATTLQGLALDKKKK